jgi:hypothetical protein
MSNVQNNEATKAETPKKKLVPADAKRKLTASCKKAVATVKEKELILTADEQKALEGIAGVRKIVGTDLQKEGKLTPLGHKADKQNGKVDRALLAMTDKIDFISLCKAVAAGDQTGRRSDLENNKAMMIRMRDHINYLAGLKADTRELPKRLAKVGHEKEVKAIREGFVPFAKLFTTYVENCV